MIHDRYQLIDFGDGRKLESLAGYRIERPCPAAAGCRVHDPQAWKHLDARYDPQAKAWEFHQPWPQDLDVDCDGFRMPLRPTPFGHIGLFPEQADNWRWLADPHGPRPAQPRRALNLFGYTGASTLALLRAGYHVAHLDAAKPNVQALRAAAEHNHLANAPIRYLVEDAARFAARELRRGRSYQTIVLDPPAYGHSPQGRAWRIERDLWPLLDDCLRLLEPNDFRLLVTGHSAEVGQADVARYLRESGFLPRQERTSGLLLQTGRSQLRDLVGRHLDAGFFVRVQFGL